MMRRWSVFLCPVVLAAMSDMTRSAGPPSISTNLPGALSSRKSSWMNSTPGMGSMGRRSMPTILPLGPTFLAAICDQPPVGDPQALRRESPADGLQDRAARQNQIGALPANARIVRPFLEVGIEQALDHRGDLAVAHPHAVHPAAVVARQSEMDAANGGDGSGGAQEMEIP